MRAAAGAGTTHRKVSSYYPITAYEAQTGQILRVKNRPRNIQEGKASLVFLHDLCDQIRATLGKEYPLGFRIDGATYAIKVPFYTWACLKGLIQKRRRWRRLDGTISYFAHTLPLEQWNKTLWVVVYRKRVRHWTWKNFQLDLFDPADGHFEYSAVVTTTGLGGQHLWWFMCGRGSHEKAYAELKTGFAFDSVPTKHYGANSAW